MGPATLTHTHVLPAYLNHLEGWRCALETHHLHLPHVLPACLVPVGGNGGPTTSTHMSCLDHYLEE
jgi:hypothetical protein